MLASGRISKIPARLLRVGWLPFLAALFLPAHALADTKPAWVLNLDAQLRWFRGAPAGVLLVGTDREVLGVQRDKGSVLWRLGPAEDSQVRDVEPLAPLPYALVSLGKRKAPGLPSVFLVDVRDGRTVWVADSLGVGWSIGSYLIPGTERLLLRSALKPKGKAQTAMFIDVNNGRRLWTRQELGENLKPETVPSAQIRGFEGPLFESDSTMILFMDSRTLRKYDLKTGAVLWEAKDLPSPSASTNVFKKLSSLTGDGSEEDTGAEKEEPQTIDVSCAPMLMARSGDRFYAPYLNTVVPVARATGRPLWRSPPELPGVVVQMQEISSGLLVRTLSNDRGSPSYALVLLELETGQRRWRISGKGSGLLAKLAGSWSSTSNFLLDGDRLLIATEGKLMTVDIASGKDRVLGKLAFESGDDPVLLYQVPEGLCVAGTQNLGIYSSEDGRRIRKYYRAAPGGTGKGLALLSVTALTWGTGFLDGALSPEGGFNELVKDYTSTQERDNFFYFLADLQAGGATKPGLVRVNKGTGSSEGEIILGTKKPVYMIDPNGRVIFTPDRNTLTCYEF